MAAAKYTLGIDLGTSNCAVAFGELGTGGQAQDFPIQQAQRDGQAGPSLLLPSALYALTEGDLPRSAREGWVAGQYARWRGARVPGRLITSAKSWLCHPAVDRTAGILPWGGAGDVAKLSPVQASARILRHLREAWDDEHPSALMADQEVVITVPASFDEVARALTVSAAREAGIERFTLLEEPQAAFYHFCHRHQKRLGTALETIRLVLVVDVGGGTTDLTLVQTAPGPDGPLLKRIAAGNHLILGGDNMDMALARRVEEKLSGRKLSPAQWIQLVQAAREAKETLLGEDAPAETRIALAGEGSKLLGGTISAVITREEVETLILDGFFPQTREFPARAPQAGIRELGLPYVAEPAITKHLAAFLHKHAESAFKALGQKSREALPRPDAVLLNGGVFNSSRIADRLLSVISSWWPDQPRLPALAHDNLDLAVARGAACYGLVRHGQGRRISGGTAHAYYLGVAPEKGQESAVCLIPRGLEEGACLELKDLVFKLQVGRPVQFPLYSSTADRADRAGDRVSVGDDFERLPPIQSALKSGKARAEKIDVYLRAKLTEIGTIELWCAAAESNEQWRLEFEVRGAAAESLTVTESLPARMGEARQCLAKIFGNKPVAGADGPKDVRQLWASLEKALGPRQGWAVPALRELWGEFFAGASRRRRSADHEKVFFQLLGYTLRPGFGYALDEWRCEQSFKLFGEFVEFHREKPNWNEFWVLWRRVAGGLSSEHQKRAWDYLKPHLALSLPAQAPKNLSRPKGVQPEGLEEMTRAAAAMEHLPAEEKEWLGETIIARVRDLKPAGGPWAWALGRLGARALLYGSAHQVVAPLVAERWIAFLISQRALDGAGFALAQIARRTGDRVRDIGEETRATVIGALSAAPNWLPMVTEAGELKSADEARVFGESLPLGLQLDSRRRERSLE